MYLKDDEHGQDEQETDEIPQDIGSCYPDEPEQSPGDQREENSVSSNGAPEGFQHTTSVKDALFNHFSTSPF